MTESPIIAADKVRAESPAAPVEPRFRGIRLIPFFAFAALLGLFALQLWLHISRASATSDEPTHIVAGYRYWQCGDFGINPEHPPLVKFLAALPIRSSAVVPPAWPCGSKVNPKYLISLAAAQFLSQNGVDRILIPTRIAVSLISLLLATLVFLVAWKMFGKAEALVALTLLVFEPTIIAHGSLVTTDMGITATILLAVYALYSYCRKPNAWRLVLAGLAVGLMLATKHSGILMLPVFLLLLFLDGVVTRKKSEAASEERSVTHLREYFIGRRFLRRVAAYLGILLIGMTVLWASYGFRFYALPGVSKRTLPMGSILKTHPEMTHSISGKVVAIMYYSRVFPEAYTFGMADIIGENQKHPSFILGRTYPTGRWFYFPIAFIIKTSIALLLLFPLALLVAGLYRKHPREMIFLLVPSLAFFAISLTAGLNIGVRHILPVYPYFLIVAAAGACELARKQRFLPYALGALLLFHVVAAIRTAPNYLPFANDFWGGTNNTYRFLDDSNVDWAQNLKIAGDYVKREGLPDCWFAYLGPGAVAQVNKTCHFLPAPGWDISDEIVEAIPPVIEGTFLISTEVLPPHYPDYEAIAKTEPVAILGGSIFVYRGRFEIPLVAAISHMGRSSQYQRLQQYDQALAEGQQAVELVPEHPRPHRILANTYLELKKNDEARQELETAIRLSQGHPDYESDRQTAQQLLDRIK